MNSVTHREEEVGGGGKERERGRWRGTQDNVGSPLLRHPEGQGDDKVESHEDEAF